MQEKDSKSDKFFAICSKLSLIIYKKYFEVRVFSVQTNN